MTLLRPNDIENIIPTIKAYDAHLQAATGASLLDIASFAAETEQSFVPELIGRTRVICVPTTSGQGRIQNFVEALACIAKHIGFEALALARTDVAGLAEAYEKQADIILTADDSRFVAINTHTLRVVDNAEATGKGFTCALDRLVGGLKDKRVLVLGCGPVGRSACLTLLRLKAHVALFDTKPWLCREFVDQKSDPLKKKIQIETDLKAALHAHAYVIDATPAANIIDATIIAPSTFIAAPGVPCGVSDDARPILKERLIHDPLQIGVATMLLLAVYRSEPPLRESG
jgi:pyrrolysine biosynthesis protein PylD